MWYYVVYGIRNIFRWLPIIWFDRDFDWEFLAEIMEFKLRKMAASTKDWHVAGADKDRRNMLICAELLRRQKEGLTFYMDNAERRWKGRHAVEVAIRQEREDLKYLGYILGKYLTHWWD